MSSDSEEFSPKMKIVGLPPKPIDHHKLLTYFLAKHDSKRMSEVDNMLEKYKGKEHKLFLTLAKKYDASNALNRVFVSRVTDEHFDHYLALTTLYLSVFYPNDVDQAEKLCAKMPEDELFKKLSSNFHAINPMKMDRKSKTEEEISSEPIDYKEVLVSFYKEHDCEKVAGAEEVLSKCKGKEAILFSVLASKYNTTNALNAVFEERVKDLGGDDLTYLTVLKIMLTVFHPSCTSTAKSMLLKHRGKEQELFGQLSKKFRAINPLEMEVCADIGKASLEGIEEAEEEKTAPTVIENSYSNSFSATPVRRSVRRVPRSPAVTP